MSNKEKMTLHIVIDGESAEELFAVGPNDLRTHFLKKIGVKQGDVKQISFKQIAERDEDNFPTKWTVHKDNYSRGEAKLPTTTDRSTDE